MSLRRVLAALVATLAVPASAQAAAHVRAVDASGYPHVRLTVVTSSPTIVPSLLENGRPVSALRVENLGREKSMALLVDRSRSMAGQSLVDAVAAARAFIARKPRVDRIAVVVFGSKAVQLTGFSSAPDEAESALDSLAIDAHQGTALYDALTLSSALLSREPNAGRVILLVTDGRDVSSRRTLAQAVAAARSAGAAVYAVAITGPQFSPAALTAVAQETGGSYRATASSSSLAAIYAGIAQELRRTWTLDYVTAGRPGDSLQLAVTGDGRANVRLALPGKAAPAKGLPVLPAAAYGQKGTAVLITAVFVSVLLAIGLAFASFRSGRLHNRLEPHVGPRVQKARRRRPRRARLAVFGGLFRVTERVLANTRQWRSAQRLLDRADLPLRAVELFYLSIAISLGLGLLVSLAGLSTIGTLIAFAIGAMGPIAYVAFKAKRRAAAFEEQLPDLLISLASSLKAGHSFKQGLQSAVDEGHEPTGKELKRVLAEGRLGRPLEQSLAEMADRLGSENFAFVVTAVNIQNQVGGSLAGLFDTVADTVRQRQQFTRKIRSLTAMGRMSAYVLVGLPVFVGLALNLLNPGYMAPLWHSATGRQLVMAALVMMVVGSLILRKIVSFRG